MLDQANYTPRLLSVYRETVRPAMKEEFGYKNDMQIPRLDKIVLNIGCGAEAVRDSKKAKSAQDDLTTIAGQQVMPVRDRLALGPAAISAARRQPWHLFDQAWCQSQAVGHEGLAMAIVRAARGGGIEQLAGDIRLGDLASILVFELVQAATPATVAQGFPLLARQDVEIEFPEPLSQRTHRPSSAATPSALSSTGSSAIGLPSRSIKYPAFECCIR